MRRAAVLRAHASASQPETAPANRTSRALGENAGALPLPTLDAVGFSEPPKKSYGQHRAWNERAGKLTCRGGRA